MARRSLLMLLPLLAAAGFAAIGPPVRAAIDGAVIDVDTKSRARVIRERAQLATGRIELHRARVFRPGDACAAAGGGTAGATPARPGAVPGQVFDRAPGSTTVANGSGC